jgi:probable F420-dependent oxidoreductase
MFDELGKFGVYRFLTKVSPAQAATYEQLGFGALWIGGSPAGDLLEVEALLDATSSITVATGIVNIWKDDAPTVAASYHRIEANHPGRFLLGVGVGHREATGARYSRPYAALVDYLDDLDAAGVPKERRLLAALGPKVLRLSADRSLGAHPYLVPAEHSRRAREILGAGVLLAPEHKVVVDADVDRARELARRAVEPASMGLVNYTNNLRTLGYDDADLLGSASDKLVDALVAFGDMATIVARLTAHLDAGADHVAINVVTEPDADPIPAYTVLAEALF